MRYEEFLTLVEYNLPLILGIIVVLMVILIILTLSLLLSNRKLKKRYNLLMKDAHKESLEDMIKGYQMSVEQSSLNSKIALEKIDQQYAQLNRCIQKIGVVRFQAFDDVGSDLSYSVALLNGENTGVILTSIFGRNMSTSYAKPVTEGVSKYAFSSEEKDAFNKALGMDENKEKKKVR